MCYQKEEEVIKSAKVAESGGNVKDSRRLDEHSTHFLFEKQNINIVKIHGEYVNMKVFVLWTRLMPIVYRIFGFK